MADTKKPAKPSPAAKVLGTDTNPERTPERDQKLMANLATMPSYAATGTRHAFLPSAVTNLSTVNFIEHWSRTKDICDKVAIDGEMTHPESMLMAQAMSLETIFNRCAELAAANIERLPAAETLLRMALKAQAQCTQTLRVLGELKAPKSVSFIKQQNNAAGNQQVNNGPVTQGAAPARAHETQEQTNQTNELLTDEREAQHAATLDTRATGRAGQEDSQLETVGAVDRADD